MREFVWSIFLIAATYVCSTGFAIVLFRIFFPLKTKSIEASKLTVVEGGNRWRPLPAREKVQLLSVGGRKAFVKVSS